MFIIYDPNRFGIFETMDSLGFHFWQLRIKFSKNYDLDPFFKNRLETNFLTKIKSYSADPEKKFEFINFFLSRSNWKM